jgi:hypothetical protein
VHESASGPDPVGVNASATPARRPRRRTRRAPAGEFSRGDWQRLGRGTQHQRHRPQRRQQPPHPPHLQPRQAQPRQARQPPQRQPQATCCKPAVPCSLSNRWNVARLMSAISSSFRTRRCSDQLSSDCGTSAAGSVDADALPTSESPSPTAPSAVAAAALVVLCSLPACFLRAMVISFDTTFGSS